MKVEPNMEMAWQGKVDAKAQRSMRSWRMLLLILGCVWTASLTRGAVTQGWLSWRGPANNGTSPETRLPDQINTGGADVLWTAELPGQSTPVIANGRLYIMGYWGDGPDLQEVLACFDAETGQKHWQKPFNDFLSDTIYRRYATSSPTIDPETGNVYFQGTQGILGGFTPEGIPLWQHSLMELYGRLTFPNSRTASPLIDRDLVITRGITANWGAQGAGGDRFYAFEKNTGNLVWSSSPGERPQDNSFSYPVLSWWQGRRVLYSATGDGGIVCVNARTGEPYWRIPLFKAGINASLILYNQDTLVSIFGTPYEPGQMVALKIPQFAPASNATGAVVVARAQAELWSNELRTSTSSPILVGDRVYVVSEVGNLCAVDVKTGRMLWKLKLGIEQRNSCPLYADGKLYVPILNDPGIKEEGADEATGGKGAFYVIKPGDSEATILSHTVLEGRCFGSPTAFNGKVYQQTTRKLYCFGQKGNNPGCASAWPQEQWPASGAATQLQIIPSEVLLQPGQKASFHLRTLDAQGLTVADVTDLQAVKWVHYVPPAARVKSSMKGEFNEAGELIAGAAPTPSAGAFEATYQGLKGTMRGRVLPGLPVQQDFESFELSETNAVDGARFTYPPLPWIGARFKFEVRDLQGNKVLAKTLDNKFFQRATVFLGDPSLRDYTVEADVMSEGNRRKMSDAGIVNQRYLIVLKGNEQKLEINSNQEVFRASAPFKWSPNTWYHLKARVDLAEDGAGTVRAKAWKKDDPEPENWTIEAKHRHAHRSGSPGLFGFSPQDMRTYHDNLLISKNP